MERFDEEKHYMAGASQNEDISGIVPQKIPEYFIAS